MLTANDTQADPLRIEVDRIAVLVVDDHPVVREGVKLLIGNSDSMRLAGYAGTGAEARRMAQKEAPDLVLLDLRLPDTTCPELVRKLRAIAPGTRILLFTAHADERLLAAALDAGAHGCLLKDVAGPDLTDVIRRVAAGEDYMDPRITLESGPRRRNDTDVHLTDREYEVLRHVAMGESNPEVGEELGLALNTVKSYLQSVMRKLGARNRVEAIIRASEQGLL